MCLRAIKHHYSLLMQCSRSAGGRVAVLGQLVDDFNGMMLSQPALDDVETRKRIVARFLQRLFSVKGGTNILLNNVFMAPRIELVNYMEDALFIAVERDARDQFVARKTESRDAGHQNLHEFAAMLTKGRAKFQRIRASIPPEERDKRLLVLRFDAFVRDDDGLRDKLPGAAGPAQGRLVPDTERFDPSVSVKNVGIHAGQLSEEELAWVDNELGVYMR
ncbi:hypothetical protein HK414_14805 [Ramlibacter terrae]|uniref:Uncharacterized protein n=1 Tax=Ramlibacter terrae TaxID=2732511 RepID=A0ABX6P358_9BURK|nr:hypothetical protein HK414_14805 [Ramlibacter terrae]